MNRINARLLAATAFALVALIARKPALGADASALTVADAPVASSTSSPVDEVPPTPPNGPRANLEIDDQGNATKTLNGVTTRLTPEQFYAAVGRDDLAEAVRKRRAGKERVGVVGGTMALVGTGLLLAASGVGERQSCTLPTGGHVCATGASSNANVDRGMAIGGGGMIFAGAGLLVGVLVGIHPDPLDDDERRDLLDDYNARAQRSDAHANAPSEQNATNAQGAARGTEQTGPIALRSLSVAPLVSDQARGVTLRMSF
jgi:hypothetical protein